MSAAKLPDDASDRPFDYGTILWWGMFDKDSEPSRFLRRRVWTGTLFFVLGFLAYHVLRRGWPPEVTRYGLVPIGSLSILWIATGFVHYVRKLDELQRQIFYESIVVTYGVVMAVGLTLACVQPAAARLVDPVYVLFAELFRNIVLAIAAWRRT